MKGRKFFLELFFLMLILPQFSLAQTSTLYEGYGEAEFFNGRKIKGYFHAWHEFSYSSDENGNETMHTDYYLTFDGANNEVVRYINNRKLKKIKTLKIGSKYFESINGKLMCFVRVYGNIKLYHGFWSGYSIKKWDFSKYSYIVIDGYGISKLLKNNIIWREWARQQVIDGVFGILLYEHLKFCNSPEDFLKVMDRHASR